MTRAADTRTVSPWQWRMGLAGILLGATWLRFSGITAGLDLEDPDRAILERYTDEASMVSSVQTRLLHGSLNPGSFLYRGPAGFLVFGAGDAAVLAGRALVHEQGWSGARAELERNPSLLHLVHRTISSLAGVLSVLVLVRLVRREFDPQSALAAGLVQATSYAHVFLSKHGTVDALWGLGTLACLDRFFLLVGAPSRKHYILGGLLIGATAAIKYFGALLVVPLVAAHFIARARARRTGGAPPAHAGLLVALALVPLAALALFPGVFSAMGDLARSVTRGFELVAPEAEPGTLLDGLAFHGYYTLWVGLGEPVLLLSLAGLVLAWHGGSTGRLLVLLIALLAPTPFLSRIPILRYATPLLVALPAAAGIALAAVARWLHPLAACAVIVLGVIPSFVRCIAFNRVIVRPDTRVEVLEFLRERAEPRDQVLALGHPNRLPRVAGNQPREQPYRSFFFLKGAGRLDEQDVVAAPPHTLLVDLSQGSRMSTGQAWLAQLIDTRFSEILRLSEHVGPGVFLPDPVTGPWLLVPFARPWSMSRPGPPLVVYERIER